MKTLETYGLKKPTILLPLDKSNLEKWAVIACDQFTQDRKYWENVRDFVGLSPSALNIILPEIFLNDADKNERVEKINSTMKSYIDNGVFAPAIENMIYVERTTHYGRVRKGLVVAIDLEQYDWQSETHALIRATEQTILERIPPRVEIRKNALLELPHIMLLVNDSEKCLIEKTGEIVKKSAPLYKTRLMMNSGFVAGWEVSFPKANENVLLSLEKIAQKMTQIDKSVFLFAVGDGNHSLATAKTIWNELKAQGTKDDDPRRFALVEIVNLYDDGIVFEPIHRVLFDVDSDSLLKTMCARLNGKLENVDSCETLKNRVAKSRSDFGFVYQVGEKINYTLLKTDITDLAVSRLQPLLDDFLKKNGYSEKNIDYVHGAEEVLRLGGKNKVTSILLPPIAKESFFETIANRGILPRKSFSMGEASEKRFYMETRKLAE